MSDHFDLPIWQRLDMIEFELRNARLRTYGTDRTCNDAAFRHIRACASS